MDKLSLSKQVNRVDFLSLQPRRHENLLADREIAVDLRTTPFSTPRTSGYVADHADVAEPMIYKLRIAVTSPVHDVTH